jgi:hypothetical protein
MSCQADQSLQDGIDIVSLLRPMWTDFHETGSVDVIDKMIVSSRKLLEQHYSPDTRIDVMTQLAGILYTRASNFDDERALLEAMSLEREILVKRPESHPKHWFHCLCAATTMDLYYERTQELSVLKQIVALNREAIETHVPDSGDQRGLPMAYAALADSLRSYWIHSKDIKLLREAIDVCRRVLVLRPLTHSLHAEACEELAHNLECYYRYSDDPLGVIQESVSLRRLVLVISKVEGDEQAELYDSLRDALQMLYSLTNDAMTLRECLDVSTKAISACKSSSMLGTRLLVSHACLLCEHQPIVDHQSTICAAMEACRALRTAVTITALPSSHRTDFVYALRRLHGLTKDPDVLQEAIMTAREAYAAFSGKHRSYRILTASTLGILLRAACNEVWNDALMAEAVAVEREALALCLPGHAGRHFCCTNLSNNLCYRFEGTGDQALLDEAIDLSEEALKISRTLPADYE